MNDALPKARGRQTFALLSNNHPQPTENAMKKTSKKTSKKSTTTATKKATNASTTPESNADSKEMNAQLQTKCEVIRKLLITTDVNTVKARCIIGHHVVQVMEDENKYGKNGVKQLAVGLDRDADTLYDFANVAKLLATEPFKELFHDGSVNGLPLSFSHWVVIAKADETIREQLTRQALSEGLSVRELKAEIEPEKTDAGQDGVARLEKALDTSKKRLERDLTAVVAELNAGGVSDERAAIAEKLLGLLRELRAAADRGIENLGQALDSVRKGNPNSPPPFGSANGPQFNGNGGSLESARALV